MTSNSTSTPHSQHMRSSQETLNDPGPRIVACSELGEQNHAESGQAVRGSDQQQPSNISTANTIDIALRTIRFPDEVRTPIARKDN